MIGIDLVHLPRIRVLLDGTHGKRFIEKAFTENEKIVIEAKKGNAKTNFVGSQFAVKEAVIKASVGKLNLGDLKKIAVKVDGAGRQIVSVRKNGIDMLFCVSQSFDAEYAIGIALQVKTDDSHALEGESL